MISKIANRLAGLGGYELRPRQASVYPADFTPAETATWEAVRPYTMTSPERTVGLTRAVEYVCGGGIPGDIVECGVWRGGSMMAVARALLALGDTGRTLHLFDTFDGMPPPADVDKDLWGNAAAARLSAEDRGTSWTWAVAQFEDVQRNIETTRYPADRLHFVRGRVEETIPAGAPERIALLRLDTDWYESTRHELEHLFPRLSPGGVLIIDDYGHWEGARRAVDEYFSGRRPPMLLNRLDYTGRIGVKLA
jgi:hypothetical protein